MQRFKNKTILITGASSGIGLVGAEQLVKEGAKLVITGRTHSRLEKALDYLGKNTIGILDDVSDGKTIDRLLPIVKEIGALDGLWLNAAYAVGGAIETMDKDSIAQMFQVNVFAPMLQMGALSPYLKEGASVVVTSSSAVYEGQPNVSLYSASKAAILSAARCWAAELAPRHIRVNTLVPGPIKSNLRAVLPDELRQQFEEDLAKVLLLKRVGEPNEASAVALFLLSDEASYVTGSSFTVDGGLLMQ